MSKPTYRIPSGMGGVFIVIKMHEVGGDMIRVRIHMPGNRDFHRHRLTVHRDKLTPA